MVQLIEIYISTHKPVSSKELSQLTPLSESTIRKDLQRLESYGFIYKPSPSSGRIPSNQGIKHYVKQLIKGLDYEEENPAIPNFLPASGDNFSHISDNFLSQLSTTTRNIGFIFLHSIFDLSFKKIKLVKVGAHRVMALLQSLNGWSFSKVFTTHINYGEEDLKNWENILNLEFKGKNLKIAFKRIRNRLHKEKEKYLRIYRELYFLLGNEDLMTAEFLFKGTVNILDSELVNPAKIKKLVEALEEKEKLSHFLNDILRNNPGRTPIATFGNDTGISDLEDFILIFSNFFYSHSRNPLGNIGVIGPKFLPYQRTISQVDRFSTYFSKILSKNPREV